MKSHLSPLRIIIVLLISPLVFSNFTMAAEPPAPAAEGQGKVLADLVGSKWRLVELGGKPVVDGSEATLEITAADKVAGRGSVNRFGGGIAIENGQLKMGPFMVTRMAGPEPLMNQEQAYLDALAKATTFSVKDDSLTVQVDGQPTPLRFARIPKE